MPINLNIDLTGRRKQRQLQDQLRTLQQGFVGQEAAGPPTQAEQFPFTGGVVPPSPQADFISKLLGSQFTAERGVTEALKLMERQRLLDQTRTQQQQLTAATEEAALTSPDIAKIAPFIGLLGGEATKALGAAITPTKKTTLQKNLAAFGVDITTPEGQKIGLDIMAKPAVQINQAPDLPTNFMWNDPNTKTGVVPIPGGPADPEIKSFNDRAKKLRESNLKVGQVEQSVSNYRNLITKHGPTLIPGASKAALQTGYTDILLEMKELYNLGVLNGPDLMLMQRVLIDPSSVMAKALGADTLMKQLDIVDVKIQSVRERAKTIYGNELPSAVPPPPGTVIRQVR